MIFCGRDLYVDIVWWGGCVDGVVMLGVIMSFRGFGIIVGCEGCEVEFNFKWVVYNS